MLSLLANLDPRSAGWCYLK